MRRVLLSAITLSACDESSFFFSSLFFTSFTIFMRAAKGPFRATIWEQPLTVEVGPMGAGRRSLAVVGRRVGRSIMAGLAAVWWWYCEPGRFRVVCPIQHLHERLRQSSCVWGCSCVCVCACAPLNG